MLPAKEFWHFISCCLSLFRTDSAVNLNYSSHFQLIQTWYVESFCKAKISKVIIRNLCGEGQNDTEESRRFVAGTRNVKEHVALDTIDHDIST